MVDTVGESMTSFDSASALKTLERVLARTPLAGTELILLRPPADNAVIVVPAAGIVARIAVALEHRDRLRRELEFATWLLRRGVNAVGPAASPPTPQLVEADGRLITWWRHLPATERATAADLGRLLAQVHRQTPPWPELPLIDPWSRVGHQLAAAERGLAGGEVSKLREHWRYLQARWSASRWPTESAVVLHGDIHQGNTLVYQDHVYLLDFEDSALGPRQWDVASIIGSWKLGWLTDEEYARFVAAYGHDCQEDLDIRILVDISLFRRTCWLASRAGREPEIVENVRHRIATLADPSLPRRWRKG